MTDSSSPYLNLHVPPDEMVKYIQDLMMLPQSEIAAGSALTLAQREAEGLRGIRVKSDCKIEGYSSEAAEATNAGTSLTCSTTSIASTTSNFAPSRAKSSTVPTR